MAASLLETSRDTDLRRDAALVLFATGARNQAIAILRELVVTVPTSSDYSYWLAALLSQTGRIQEASDVLRAWCTRRPGNPRMEQAYAFTLVRLGRVDEARRRAALSVDGGDDDPETSAQLERWMAQPGWRGGG
jgi:Flp pilus assembly protein TadD